MTVVIAMVLLLVATYVFRDDVPLNPAPDGRRRVPETAGSVSRRSAVAPGPLVPVRNGSGGVYFAQRLALTQHPRLGECGPVDLGPSPARRTSSLLTRDAARRDHRL